MNGHSAAQGSAGEAGHTAREHARRVMQKVKHEHKGIATQNGMRHAKGT
jgi:hypothetical protein